MFIDFYWIWGQTFIYKGKYIYEVKKSVSLKFLGLPVAGPIYKKIYLLMK